MKIVVFYHCLLRMGDPPQLQHQACEIVKEQMAQLEASGLINEASDFIVGLNDDREGLEVAQLFIHPKADFILHGLSSRSECLTIVAIEQWVKEHPEEAYICYFHAKGASHPADSSYGNTVSAPWRRAMMLDMVTNWKTCVGDLNAGAELVCSRFLYNMADGSQHIPCGNFLWLRASFVRTLPSIFQRARIKESGIASLESRYEAEVYWGNGARLPVVAQYRPQGGGGIP